MKAANKTLKKLDSISPSRFFVMKRCSYRVVLANTYGNPLLPYPPNSHLGNVIHECIRLILTNQIQDDIAFNAIWAELIKKEEVALKKMGFEFLIPLKKSVKKGYAIKKLQVKSLMYSKNNNKKDRQKKQIVYDHERWMRSEDGLIVGRADLITEREQCTKITDFKTGRIVEEEGDIKEKIEDQMKLYAYLYNEENGNFPDELLIIDLSQKEYLVEFSIEECILLAKEAKQILQETNNKVRKNLSEKLANASHDNCRLCLYKPACVFHWNLDQDEKSDFVNLKGKLSEVKQFTNGDITARINNNGEEFVISHLDGSYANQLKGYSQVRLEFYNVLKSDHPGRYRAIKTTSIYEE